MRETSYVSCILITGENASGLRPIRSYSKRRSIRPIENATAQRIPNALTKYVPESTPKDVQAAQTNASKYGEPLPPLRRERSESSHLFISRVDEYALPITARRTGPYSIDLEGYAQKLVTHHTKIKMDLKSHHERVVQTRQAKSYRCRTSRYEGSHQRASHS